VQGKGWLAKCGYHVPDDTHGRLVAARRFLGELEVVAGILGLTVVAFHVPTQRWIDFEALKAVASQRNSGPRIEEHHLRIYGPTDYHERLRTYLEGKGQMRIPRLGDGPESVEGESSSQNDELWARMKRLGVTHQSLSEHLECSQQFVTQMLGGRRPWPEGLFERAERHLEELDG
jgi:hypothetical protein